jgi:protoporphyrinogen oxidase
MAIPSNSPDPARSRIVILGAGPTGLGAAWRLTELGLTNFTVFEQNPYPGGLAASFAAPDGFTWDIGGHVQFSHYGYFDRLMDSLLPGEWLGHLRASYVWILDRFVPYPFQRNIHFLPRPQFLACLAGLIETARRRNALPHAHFGDWIDRGFGTGIARLFLRPYNFKVWAWPPERLDAAWVGERVSPIDLPRLIRHILAQTLDAGWGPNNTFRFPASGGTGEIWRRLAARLPAGGLRLNSPVESIDLARRRLTLASGAAEPYDILISTIPLDRLLRLAGRPAPPLLYSSSHIAGIGLLGQTPGHLRDKSWMYFPEPDAPFYRATVFSNYSPANVPDPTRHWSLLLEVSESPAKPVDSGTVIEEVIRGLEATRLIPSRRDIVSVWYHKAVHGYPTPFLDRDAVITPVLRELESRSVFSRGRFGAWKYEVSNQDHSLMQGVELADRLALGAPELTLWNPALVNGPRNAA